MHAVLWPSAGYESIAFRGGIAVAVERLSATSLRLGYVVRGPIDQLVVSPPAPPSRADNLWKTTCFEAFLAADDDPGYLELNFSPSSQWAVYDFASYRSGMVRAALPAPPEIEVERQPDRLALTATLSLHLGAEPYRLGLAAVIEETGGRLSYWALAHPSGSPDFHRRDCFALELPPPQRQ